MISVCGMVATDKSEYATAIAERIATEKFYINPDSQMSMDFHQNPVDNMFASQVYHISERFRLMQEALKYPRFVLEQHMIEDKLFAEVAYDLKRMTPQEKAVYDRLGRTLESALPAPDSEHLYVYLKAEFDTLIERMDPADYTPGQWDEILEYYNALHTRYDSWVEKHVPPKQLMVIDVDDRNINDTSQRSGILEDIVLKMESLGI